MLNLLPSIILHLIVLYGLQQSYIFSFSAYSCSDYCIWIRFSYNRHNFHGVASGLLLKMLLDETFPDEISPGQKVSLAEMSRGQSILWTNSLWTKCRAPTEYITELEPKIWTFEWRKIMRNSKVKLNVTSELSSDSADLNNQKLK